MDPRTAARILDLADERARHGGSPSRAFAGFALILALAAHGGASSGSPRSAQAAAMSPAGARQAFAAQAGESPEMKQLMAIGVAAAVSAGASAQDAVQWRVQDGGNGHWYQAVVVPAGVTWESARDRATDEGGYLACLETPSEGDFVFTRFSRFAEPSAWIAQTSGAIPVFGPWIGAWQMAGSVEPTGGWRWLTGGFFDPTAPSECCNNSCIGSSNEDRLQLYFHDVTAVTGWNDLPSVVTCGNQPISYIIEFDADCNDDGVIDGTDLAIVLAGWGGCA